MAKPYSKDFCDRVVAAVLSENSIQRSIWQYSCHERLIRPIRRGCRMIAVLFEACHGSFVYVYPIVRRFGCKGMVSAKR
jgi:hypothetical protein